MARAHGKSSSKFKKRTQLGQGNEGEGINLSEVEDQINNGTIDNDTKKRQNKLIDTTNR